MQKVILVVLTAISILSSCTQPVSLGPGITTTIKSVRTWAIFDANKPVDASHEFWVTGNYSINVACFAPSEGIVVEKATGRFLELQVWFTNKGQKEATLDFITNEGTELDARLLFDQGKTAKVRAFLIPGLGIAPISLVTFWKGNLGIKLNPGQETWLLLVFDIPADIKTAKLQIKNLTPIPIILQK